MVLATPEIGGLPFVISGLLLTIANALSHDVYYKVVDLNASATRRVAIFKSFLVLVAAAFFRALTLRIFSKRANKWGASMGMVAGLGISFEYMVTMHPWIYGLLHDHAIASKILKAKTWWDIAPILAGVFGVPQA
nr:hypothetical protein [uncultured Rhodoferax sp.]